MRRRPPRSTRTYPLFPYTTLFRSAGKRVLILEKAALVGGTTATSGGVMWIPNNRFMKEAGVPDSREQAIAYLDAAVGAIADAGADMPGASRERRVAFVDAAPQMIDFPVAQGLKLRRLQTEKHRDGKECVSTRRNRWAP